MEIRNKFRKFQDGGEVNAPDDLEQAPQEGEAPTDQELQGPPQLQEDPMELLLQVAAMALQKQDCRAAMAVCQALLQLALGGDLGLQASQEEPTFARNGARLIRVRR